MKLLMLGLAAMLMYDPGLPGGGGASGENHLPHPGTDNAGDPIGAQKEIPAAGHTAALEGASPAPALDHPFRGHAPHTAAPEEPATTFNPPGSDASHAAPEVTEPMTDIDRGGDVTKDPAVKDSAAHKPKP